MAKQIYIAQAIPYVNAAPHVGHALEYVQADCLARFYRALGYETFYSDGAGKSLDPGQKEILEKVKVELRSLFS